MDLIKQAAIEAIKRLPNECTVEDVMYQVFFISQVLDGLNDVQEGKIMTTEELLARVEKWSS